MLRKIKKRGLIGLIWLFLAIDYGFSAFLITDRRLVRTSIVLAILFAITALMKVIDRREEEHSLCAIVMDSVIFLIFAGICAYKTVALSSNYSIIAFALGEILFLSIWYFGYSRH